MRTEERNILKEYSENHMESLTYGDVIRAFYMEGYGVERAKLHVRDWFEIGLAYRRPGIHGEYSDLVVFSGELYV